MVTGLFGIQVGLGGVDRLGMKFHPVSSEN